MPQRVVATKKEKKKDYLHPAEPEGTQRPDAPEASVQTSWRRLVLATQQAPLATGRPALLAGVWAGPAGARGSTGVGVARASATREKRVTVILVNCILSACLVFIGWKMIVLGFSVGSE